MAGKMKCFRIALIQMAVGRNKADNIKKAVSLITDAKSKGSHLVVLPECFNSPYGTKYFDEFAEKIPEGETSNALSEAAKQNNVFIVGGSIPEREGSKLYNTSTVWNPIGELICKHRKVHLFDIDIPGGITFKESDVLSPGQSLSIFTTDFCKVGLGICYDMRFQEMATLYRKAGADVILFPGAFNMKTGPLHWELLLRARAVDNQVFVAGVCGAQDKNADYIAWGHTTLVSPWGEILAKAEFEEQTVIADIDLNVCDQIRQQIPIEKQKRIDLYETISKSNL